MKLLTKSAVALTVLLISAGSVAMAQGAKTKDISIKASLPESAKGKVFLTLTGSATKLTSEAPKAGATPDVSNAPIAIKLAGESSATLTKTVSVPTGTYKATLFIREGKPECPASESSFEKQPICVPSKGDIICPPTDIDTAHDSSINIPCGDAKPVGAK